MNGQRRADRLLSASCTSNTCGQISLSGFRLRSSASALFCTLSSMLVRFGLLQALIKSLALWHRCSHRPLATKSAEFSGTSSCFAQRLAQSIAALCKLPLTLDLTGIQKYARRYARYRI